MILLSELSRRRIRSIQKLIRVGRNEVVVVLRVDKEKGAYFALTSHTGVYASVVPTRRSSDLYQPQDTSTFRNVVSHPRTSQNARSAT